MLFRSPKPQTPNPKPQTPNPLSKLCPKSCTLRMSGRQPGKPNAFRPLEIEESTETNTLLGNGDNEGTGAARVYIVNIGLAWSRTYL